MFACCRAPTNGGGLTDGVKGAQKMIIFWQWVMRRTQRFEAALPAHLQLPRGVGRRDTQRCRGDWRRRGRARVFFAEANCALGCGEVLLLRLELLRSHHTASRSQHSARAEQVWSPRAHYGKGECCTESAKDGLFGGLGSWLGRLTLLSLIHI